MSLQITQTWGRIGIDRTPGNLDIQTTSAKLELHHKEAKVNIHSELPKIQIDQYECFASAGLKGPADLTRDFVQRAYQQVMDHIGKTAEDGDRLAAIEKGGNPIAEIAERDAWPQHEFGIDFIPKVGPSISVKGGSIEIDPEPNGEGINTGVEGDYTQGDVNINYTPSVINTYMAQYPSINVSYQPGNNVDVSL
ncbi:MAG: DUF6470 family protein [Bacillota bacterium]|nr:DUF6470 family protein [Bacillota bacterium]